MAIETILMIYGIIVILVFCMTGFCMYTISLNIPEIDKDNFYDWLFYAVFWILILVKHMIKFFIKFFKT